MQVGDVLEYRDVVLEQRHMALETLGLAVIDTRGVDSDGLDQSVFG